MPKLSVVIPTYNSAEFLPKTIGSVLAQTFNDYELIVVDDCSTDGTSEIVSQFDDRRIRYIKLEKNHGGPSRPRNVGIGASLGRYIALFDSDDIMLPGKLAASIDALERNPACPMVFTDAQKMSEEGILFPGTLLQDYFGFHRLLSSTEEGAVSVLTAASAFRLLFEENYIPTSSVVLERSVFDEIGLFDEELMNGDDKDVWFRLVRNHDICYIHCPFHQYRVRTSSVSNRGVLTAYNRIKVLEKQLAEGIPDDMSAMAKKWIAENYSGIGYVLRCRGDVEKARKNYLKSLHHKFRLHTLQGLLATYLSPRTLAMLRRLKM